MTPPAKPPQIVFDASALKDFAITLRDAGIPFEQVADSRLFPVAILTETVCNELFGKKAFDHNTKNRTSMIRHITRDEEGRKHFILKPWQESQQLFACDVPAKVSPGKFHDQSHCLVDLLNALTRQGKLEIVKTGVDDSTNMDGNRFSGFYESAGERSITAFLTSSHPLNRGNIAVVTNDTKCALDLYLPQIDNPDCISISDKVRLLNVEKLIRAIAKVTVITQEQKEVFLQKMPSYCSNDLTQHSHHTGYSTIHEQVLVSSFNASGLALANWIDQAAANGHSPMQAVPSAGHSNGHAAILERGARSLMPGEIPAALHATDAVKPPGEATRRRL